VKAEKTCPAEGEEAMKEDYLTLGGHGGETEKVR